MPWLPLPGGGSGAGGDAFSTALLHVRDEKPSGTTGGSFTAGAWQTRTLNTIPTNEITGASLTTNQVTLPAGTYFAMFSAQGALIDRHQARLRDVTSGTTLILGESTNASSSSNGVSPSGGFGRFTLGVDSLVELQHRCGTTNANGFGLSNNFGDGELYADLAIWKVA